MLNELDTHITLEMSGDTKKYLVSAKQGDKSTRRIVAKLLNEGIPYEITDDAIVVINMEKPDGKHIYNTCTYSGSEVIVELTNQALAVTGTASCDIEIRTSDNSQVLSTVTFEIEIEKSKRNENAIVSSNEYTELERRTGEHIKAIDDEHEKIKAAESKRVQAESARATAETARAGAENKRVQAESTRATAETTRQQNETTRNQQEQKRQKDTTEAVKAANSATQAATDAKNSCNSATERAESALQNQTQLTETLNSAIQIQNDVTQKQSSVEAARKEVAQNAAKIDELVKGVTPETIGAVAQKGDTAENVVSYTSNDATNPDSYTDVDLLKSGETHKSVLQKISTMFKNIRYLYKMLGTADISTLGDGTILGALCTLNSNIYKQIISTALNFSSNMQIYENNLLMDKGEIIVSINPTTSNAELTRTIKCYSGMSSGFVVFKNPSYYITGYLRFDNLTGRLFYTAVDCAGWNADLMQITQIRA